MPLCICCKIVRQHNISACQSPGTLKNAARHASVQFQQGASYAAGGYIPERSSWNSIQRPCSAAQGSAAGRRSWGGQNSYCKSYCRRGWCSLLPGLFPICSLSLAMCSWKFIHLGMHGTAPTAASMLFCRLLGFSPHSPLRHQLLWHLCKPNGHHFKHCLHFFKAVCTLPTMPGLSITPVSCTQ